jgi:putative endonuclease
LTDKGKLYTGVSNNPKKRFGQHTSGKGAKFLRNRIISNIYAEKYQTRSEAMKREWHIKHRMSNNKWKLVLGEIELPENCIAIYSFFENVLNECRIVIPKKKFIKYGYKPTLMAIKNAYGHAIQTVYSELFNNGGSLGYAKLRDVVIPIIECSEPTFVSHIKKMVIEQRIAMRKEGNSVFYEFN